MRIDLSSDDRFFQPDRPVLTGSDDGDAPAFSTLLKNFSEPDPTEAAIAPDLPDLPDLPEPELKLYADIGPELLDGYQAPEAAPITAEELAELVSQSGEAGSDAELETGAADDETFVADNEAEFETLAADGETALEKAVTLKEAQTEIQADTRAQAKAEATAINAQLAEQRAELAELEELRQDAYQAALAEQQEKMEGLIETWKENSPYKLDGPELAEQEEEDNLEVADNPDGVDDAPDLFKDLEDIPVEADAHGDSGADQESRQAQGTGAASADTGVEERELNYEEIQSLVETALYSGRHLPPRVRQVMKELLEALLDGQRWLLDQHRLIGLEPYEWEQLTQLFPPHFYAGLLRQHRHSELPLYDLLQDLYTQLPPDPERQAQLLALWQPGFGSGQLPPPLRNWVLDQPDPPAERELIQLLELWQQQQTLPPGATGRILQLALAYSYHPEKMLALFRLSQDLLHGRAPEGEQSALLAQCVYERCYPRELSDSAQIQDLLTRALLGQELEEPELMHLLTGCSQSVLSYLPYACMPPSLQHLQDYVRRDLLGREELVPVLLQEEGARD